MIQARMAITGTPSVATVTPRVMLLAKAGPIEPIANAVS